LKTQIDLSNFAVPIQNLLEPGMAEGALNALDQFIVDKTGTKMGFLYQDLIESCMSDITKSYQRQKAKIKQKANPELASPSINNTPTAELIVQQRREKEKTRPAHSSIYDIAPPAARLTTGAETAQSPPIFKVKSSTLEVFSTLFSKTEARGSVTLTAFEAAMADLKFSVMPRTGSVYTFFPSPADMGVQRSLTVHRPHKSRLEGHVLLIFASRLKIVYGWGEKNFELV